MVPVIWFYGLSGSGKTTIAKMAKSLLAMHYDAVTHLDADDLRSKYWPELNMTKEDRLRNVIRIANLVKEFTNVRAAVVVSACAPYEEQRKTILSLVPRVKFVYVNTPYNVCSSRKPQFYGEKDMFKICAVDSKPEPEFMIAGDDELENTKAYLETMLHRII